MKERRYTLAWVSFLLAAACASSGSMTAGSVSKDLPTTTRIELESKARLLFSRHQFEIERVQTESQLYLESNWRERLPFDDELAQGVETAMTRLILQGRPRSRVRDDFYTAKVILENRVRLQGSQVWEQITNTPEFERYARRVAEDFEKELSMGIQRR